MVQRHECVGVWVCNARAAGSKSAMMYYTGSVLDQTMIVPNPPAQQVYSHERYHNTIISHITSGETYRHRPLLEYFHQGGCDDDGVVDPPFHQD